jgi:hypothetical protein
VRDGGDPRPEGARNGKAIATYGHDRVVPGVAPAASAAEDSLLLRQVARRVVAEAVQRGL